MVVDYIADDLHVTVAGIVADMPVAVGCLAVDVLVAYSAGDTLVA